MSTHEVISNFSCYYSDKNLSHSYDKNFVKVKKKKENK